MAEIEISQIDIESHTITFDLNIENETLDEFLKDCRIKHVDKVNIKKLSKKLNCSDKTAKK